MLNPEHFDENGDWLSPIVEVDGAKLHYGNTRLREFGEEWAYLRHIEYRGDDGKLTGVRPTDELWALLKEKQFPCLFSYFPEESTRDWVLREEIGEIALLTDLPPAA